MKIKLIWALASLVPAAWAAPVSPVLSAPPGPAESNPAAVAGIWVLQQAGSIDELRRVEPAIADALENFDTVGFCLRFPWKAADENFALLELGREIAARHGKRFSVRFMAGRHTPERVFADGCPHYVVPAYGRRPGTDRVPAPMLPDGSANTIFEKHYRAYTARLAAWCRENGVRLLHFAWYGQDWAELNNGQEVRAVPGYAYDRWFDAHTRLIDIALELAGPDLAAELPFSGHGPTGDTCSQFADHVWTRAGAGTPHFFFQGNGWGPVEVWGSPNPEMERMKNQAFERPVNRGLQMIQPRDYDWPATFAHLYQKHATYGEVYVPSFKLAGREQLKAEIARFAAHCREQKGPVAPRGPLASPANLMQPALANPEAVSGTWALQQVAGVEELKRLLPTVIAPALATPHLRGFSLRVPWSAIDENYAVLEEGLRIAREKNLAFSVRFMAGRHTPERVFTAGAAHYVKDGRKVPAPFTADGGPNIVFEREYEKFAVHLAAWCRLNGVRLLHLAWYGQDWAELNHGREVRALPGYSEQAWTDAHLRQLDLALRSGGRSLAVELPFSGYGPLTAAAERFARHVLGRSGPARPFFFCQANGWGPNGEWGAPSAEVEAAFDRVWALPIPRGLQSIQPQDYDWTKVFARLYEVNATYAEIYAPSFTLARKQLLAEEIRKFAEHSARGVRLPEPVKAP